MILSELIKKGGLTKIATMTPATIATQGITSMATVAKVATVAVIDKLKTKLAPETQLSSCALPADDESKIRAWLAFIGETDQEIIIHTLAKCRTVAKVRLYCLQQAQVLSQRSYSESLVTCGKCAHFKPTAHRYVGHCAQGEPESIAGVLNSERRYCQSYLRKPELAL